MYGGLVMKMYHFTLEGHRQRRSASDWLYGVTPRDAELSEAERRYQEQRPDARIVRLYDGEILAVEGGHDRACEYTSIIPAVPPRVARGRGGRRGRRGRRKRRRCEAS